MAIEKDDVVSYKSKEYFEHNVLSKHSCISSFRGIDHRTYEVVRGGKSKIIVQLTGKYLFSVTDYTELRQANPNTNCIVSPSAWNHYAEDAKDRARDDNVGLFKLDEFMGALNFERFWEYESKAGKLAKLSKLRGR